MRSLASVIRCERPGTVLTMSAEVEEVDALAARRADPRYQRLMEATRAAARNGCDAVSMRELAETCRMSMTTIYQFCRSKDQLIAEAHVSSMDDARKRLMSRPPQGATPEERVLRVMRSYVRALEADGQLTRTLMRAMYSLDPNVAETRASMTNTYSGLIDAAIGNDDVPGRRAIISTLGHVIDSVVLNWLSGRHDTQWAKAELESTVHVLLGDHTELD
jgi:AcrR family transcriptional regulator